MHNLSEDIVANSQDNPPLTEHTKLLEYNSEKKYRGKKITTMTDFRRLASIAKEEKLLVGIASVSLVVATSSNLVVPFYIKALIDSTFSGQTVIFSSTILYLLALFLVASIFSFMRDTVFAIAGQRIVAKLRGKLFASIVHQDVAFFDSNRTGELISRLSSDCSVVQETMSSKISELLQSSINAIGGLVIIFIMSWKLTLILFAILPLIAIGSWLYGAFTKRYSQQYQDKIAAASSIAEEVFSNIRTVRSFSAEKEEINNYREEIWESFTLGKKTAYVSSCFESLFQLLANIGVCGILWYGSKLIATKELTIGTLTSFLVYTLDIGIAFGTLSSTYGHFMKSVGATRSVFELIERKPQVRNAGGYNLNEIHGYIQVDGISFAYPSRPEVTVLQNISIELQPGKIVALVGPSGGGKSTVVNLIQGFYYVNDGKITLDGTNLRDLDPHHLHRHIAVVNQEPSLFARSIAENIIYSMRESEFKSEQEKMSRIIEAAKMANAHEFISQFPEGYQTIVGERGVRLSGGQKQRIALARAFIRNPQVLLLDEATSALDAESEWAVKEAIDNLLNAFRKRTVLIIAHRLSTVQNADEVIVIKEGKVVERGNHNSLLNLGGVYKKLGT